MKLKKQCDTAGKKAAKVSELKSECALLEDQYAQLEDDNEELFAAISALPDELATESSRTSDTGSDDFTFETKSGRTYSPATGSFTTPYCLRMSLLQK